MANNLPFGRQVEIISALTEGVSIRATERLTGVHRDTIMRLGVRVGFGCAAIHDALMQNLCVPRLELDEAWSFVGKKQKQLKPDDSADLGDQYVFIALAGAIGTYDAAVVTKDADGKFYVYDGHNIGSDDKTIHLHGVRAVMPPGTPLKNMGAAARRRVK